MDRLTGHSKMGGSFALPAPDDIPDRRILYGRGNIKFWHLIDRLAAYEDTGLTPEAIEGMKRSFFGEIAAEISEADGGVDLRRAKEIATAEAEGRLLVLPCKVGDTVFVIAYCGEIYTHRDWDTGSLECPFEDDCDAEKCDDDTLRIFETTCFGFCMDELDKKLHICVKDIGLDSGDVLGERVFLTREEAETALGRADNG